MVAIYSNKFYKIHPLVPVRMLLQGGLWAIPLPTHVQFSSWPCYIIPRSITSWLLDLCIPKHRIFIYFSVSIYHVLDTLLCDQCLVVDRSVSTFCNRHDDVIQWRHFPRYWPFVRGIHRSPMNSPHKGQWGGALMFSLICVWINDWVYNGEAGDLRRYRTHYDVIVMEHLHQNKTDDIWPQELSNAFSG